MAAIDVVSPPRNGEVSVRDSAAPSSTDFVGTKMVPSRTAEELEFTINVSSIGSITQMDAKVQYSLKLEPDDTATNWVDISEETVSAGVVTQATKNWRWTSLATGTKGFRVAARGNYMRLFVKMDSATGAYSAAVLVRK